MSYFNVLDMPEKYHKNIQLLSTFFGLQLYHMVKYNKNHNLHGYNMCFLFYMVIFQVSHILQCQFHDN